MKRIIYIFCSLLFLLTFPGISFAQFGPPTPPPGFDQGPYNVSTSSVAQKGEFLVGVTKKMRKQARKTHVRKKGKRPSKRQLYKRMARSLGLRISRPLTSDNIFYATGIRGNTAKMQKALDKGLATNIEANQRIYNFGFNELQADFFCFLTLCWGVENYGFTLGGTAVFDVDVDASDAWRDGHEGEGVVVAVLDTGVAATHKDLAANMWVNTRETANGNDDDGNGFIDDVGGWDFANGDNDPDDDHFHGTHVAGTIAAVRGNNSGIIGVAPQAQILALKVLDGDGFGSFAGIIEAIDYTITLKRQGANIRVINASLGGTEGSQLLEQTIQRATNNDILFVAAAGNAAEDNDVVPQFPANYSTSNSGVIAVAAINSDGTLSTFSNYGSNSVQIAAPGHLVWSTIISGLYLPSSGTSMAAPHVAGVAALVASARPGLSPSQIRTRLMDTAKPLNDLGGRLARAGIVSATRALE